MNRVKVTELRDGDLIAEHPDSKTRIAVQLPRADIRKTVGLNGKHVQIVHQDPVLAVCRTQPSHVHLSTSQGIWCMHRESILYRD